MICKQNPCTAIANSIAEAITESKRTILLLSPSYVEGEWPEFEVQCALKESLRRNHRIIPIVHEPLDDVKQELSATLQHITDYITCIKWPAEDLSQDSKSSSLHHTVNRIGKQLSSKKNDDVDPVTAKQDKFWKRLLLTLPKRKQQPESNKNLEDQDKSLKSFQSQCSVQSNTSETFELIRVERKEKSNLFNRGYLDDVHSVVKPKAVQVVHPRPRRPSQEVAVTKPEVNLQVPEVVTVVADAAPRVSVDHNHVSSETAPTVVIQDGINGRLQVA